MHIPAHFAKPVRWLPLILLLLALFSAAVVGAQGVATPEVEPDAAMGQIIYSERCANCHGVQGMGDGELASRSAVPPTAFADPAVRRALVPAAMFDIITSGIMGDAGPIMPAFGPTSSNPISEEDRWHLIAAVFSLGVSADDIAAGEELYTTTCAECHAENGQDAFDLTDQAYWSERSNQNVFDALRGETIVEHQYNLSDDELWQLVDYARTFSYAYTDPLAAFAPIAEGRIQGIVTNGTVGEPFVEPVDVTLNAFTPDFQMALTQTVALEDDGSFSFVVTEAPSDLFYVVTLNYDGLQFGSDFGELDPADPALDLPFTVYESSSDPTGVSIDQMHVILEFVDGMLQVSELYQFGNDSLTVYAGPTGIPDDGTVEIVLPEGAQNPQFSHTFGSIDNLLPTDSIIQTSAGWADTIPVRPGRGSLNLLVRYSLPYEDALTLTHPVGYRVANVNMVMADAGVELANDGNWLEGGAQQMGQEVFLTYSLTGLPAESEISIPLSGEPQAIAPGGGLGALEGNTAAELLFGAGILLLVVASVGYYINLKRRHALPETVGVPSPATMPIPDARLKEDLLLQIVDLDDAFERDELDEEAYSDQRRQLMTRLVAVWRAGVEG